ncbi:hypothetical protein ACE11G_16605 [Gordonia sp. PS3]|uniref:hypothetical protein n=1 Tax=Gordonia TaxID=2053 RepID=UPI0009E4E7F3|nr:hypothetical protein [Gordonia sihwensis]WFN93047.1 hypothetical protein P5P27_00195 [Gordonia sihwensis]
MIEPLRTVIGERTRDLPAPPRAVFEDLIDPKRQPARPWLSLLDDEAVPGVTIVASEHRVIWSSIWKRRPDARIEFELASRGSGTRLTWRLDVTGEVPDASLTGHMRKRVNELLFAGLRYSYGQ